jgi:CheY-like chemotaxis protein
MPVVLNVDDRPTSLYARERLLTRRGYTVINATTGKDAIAMAERLRPDLILLDIHLPDIDGREVCRRLKADPQLQDTPVVLASTTTRGDAAQSEMIHWAGADAFLMEPFEEETLTSTLNAVLPPHEKS